MANAEELKEIAKKIRYLSVESTGIAGSGHPGGSLSVADIITVLYFSELRIEPKNPKWADRDRFVLSNGHVCPALYSALALRGFFPVEELKTLRKINSKLQGHPDSRKVPGVDASTGGLGQGLAMANGMALATKIDKKSYRVYTIISDGECQEGGTWEAAMFASHYKLDNLIAFLDRNKIQISGCTENIMSEEPLAEKWRAFGWNVQTVDGHDIEGILRAIEQVKNVKGKPSMIICNTILGKGVSFMEGNYEWHGKSASGELLKKALEELR